MPENDIELNVGANTRNLESSIKKTLAKLNFTTLPTLGGVSRGMSGTKDSFKKTLKVFKIDLYWRWIKGTWNAMIRNNALLKALGSIFDAAINLLGMALLLPIFKPLLSAVIWLLNKSVDFFNYMRSLEGLSPSKFAEKIVADINKLFTETDWKSYGEKIGTAIQNTVDFVDKFIKGLNWEKIGTSFGDFVNGVIDKLDGSKIGKTIGDAVNAAITFLTGMFDGVDWKKFGSEIGDAFTTAVKTVDWWGIIDLLWTVLKGIADFISVGLPAGITKSLTGQDILAPQKPFTAEDWKWGNVQWKGAAGGIVTSPTTALIGEAGPEAVIPLDKLGGMVSTSINVSGLVDEQKFRRIIQDEFNRMQGRLSRNRGAVSI